MRKQHVIKIALVFFYIYLLETCLHIEYLLLAITGHQLIGCLEDGGYFFSHLRKFYTYFTLSKLFCYAEEILAYFLRVEEPT